MGPEMIRIFHMGYIYIVDDGANILWIDFNPLNSSGAMGHGRVTAIGVMN